MKRESSTVHDGTLLACCRILRGELAKRWLLGPMSHVSNVPSSPERAGWMMTGGCSEGLDAFRFFFELCNVIYNSIITSCGDW